MISKRDTLSEKAALDYEGAIKNHIKPNLGNVRLRDLERRQIRAFFDGRTTLGAGGKAKVYTVLRAALNDAVHEHDPPLLIHNVAARLRMGKSSGSRAGQRPRSAEFWTPEEVEKFLRVAKSSPYYPMFLTMLSGALGQAEVFALKWENIDLKSGLISIVADLIEVEGRLVYRETKTEFRRRNFKLPGDPLRALRARHKKLKPHPSDYVFQAPQGGPIRRTTFGARVWQPLMLKANVPKITPHKLRDNAGSYLTAKGIPPGVVHRILGHSDYRTTANNYLHLFDESRDEVAAVFDDLFRRI
jgi:integrase